MSLRPCFENWQTIVDRIHAAPGLFVAFDYDGVLSPIALRPELAHLPSANHILLERLSKIPHVHVAIVSGRPLDDVRAQIQLPTLLYAGNHGAEIDLNGVIEKHIEIERYRHDLLMVRTQLSEWIPHFPGLYVEDKGFGIGLHYRSIKLTQVAELQEQFSHWSKSLPPQLKIIPAKMMYEVRPRVEWNKGNAVLRLWKSIAPQSLPFCFGDDRTDEDGFRALNGKGISIFVGTTKESSADYFLSSTDDVTIFIERLCTASEKAFGKSA